MNNPSLTIREVALLIKTQLETYATPRGGVVKVLENERHLWEELMVADERPRIFILNTGETARGEYEGGERTNLHRVDREWKVVVMRGHGFKNLTAESVGQEGTPGFIEAFSDSWETVRDGVRVLVGISEEHPVNYKGTLPLPSVASTPGANVFLDCRVIEFSTAADIPAIDANGYTVP